MLKILTIVFLTIIFHLNFCCAQHQNESNKPEIPPNRGEIYGAVNITGLLDFRKLLDNLDSNHPKSPNEFMIALQNFQIVHDKVGIAQKIEVTLHSESFSRQIFANKSGGFEFKNIPFGTYTVVAKIDSFPILLSESHRCLIDTRIVTLDEKFKSVNLTLSQLAVSVTGFVSDSAGIPIVGARVTARNIYPKYDEGYPVIWEAMTDSNGIYHISGLPHENFIALASILGTSKGRLTPTVNITVQADGYLSDSSRTNTTTEQISYLAHRFYKVYKSMPGIGAKLRLRNDLCFPKSKVNIISDINFVLSKKVNDEKNNFSF